MLEAFANTEAPSTGGRVAWLCTLTENKQLDVETIVRLAREDANHNEGYRAGRILGAALYRAKNYKEAADILAEVADQLESRSDPSQHGELASSLYFLAMARQQLGHAHQANRILADAIEIAQKTSDNSSWIERVQLKVLDQEARALIER